MYLVYADEAKDQAFKEIPMLQDFYEILPKKPYCTDQLGYLLIRPKATAIKNAYIQYNPICRAHWLVFDRDNSDPRYWPYEPHVPTPNIEIRNPKNDHQHLFYQIEPPVYTLRQARRKPLELAADVDRGLTQRLGADPGFGKLIAKNPLHAQWMVIIWHEKRWGLTELAGYIPEKESRRPKPREETGLGRNCTVFEQTRFFAYSEWRRLKFDDYDRLFEAVYAYAMNLNLDFILPMLEREVRCIVRSISKWTARHITPEGFSRWCSKRGIIGNLRSQAVRKTSAEERMEAIRAFKQEHPDMSNRMIAQVFECDEKTIRNALQS